MKRSLRFSVVLTSILIIAQRAPAPIVEEEKPTPAPVAKEQAAKRPPKTKRRSPETSEETKPVEPAKPKEPSKPKERFAGTWSGKVNQGIWGDIPFTLTFTPGGTQVTEHSGFGNNVHSASCDGQTATWNAGLLNEQSWTFTPNSDGSTAQVTANSALGGGGNSTFRRGGTPPGQKSASEFPVAKPDPNKPGFVYNPFDPTANRLLDVRGKASGTKVKDPSTGKIFIVP